MSRKYFLNYYSISLGINQKHLRSGHLSGPQVLLDNYLSKLLTVSLKFNGNIGGEISR